MKTLRLLSILLTSGALTLAACSDKDSGDTTSTTLNDDFGDGTSSGDTGTESGSTTGDTSAGTSSTTSGFVPMNDIPDVASCDPFAQDCPEGEKCVAYVSGGDTWDANQCVQIMGTGAPGDPCMFIDNVTDDCGAGSWCWDVNMEGIGACTPFCGGSADSPVCDPGTSCSIANEGSINLCLTSCDPLLQDCAGGATACFYDGVGFVCANATQNIPTGEPCGYINDCVAGNICLGPESFPSCAGASCCAQYCDFSDPNAPCAPAGTECTSFFEEGMAPPGFEDIGVCVVPA